METIKPGKYIELAYEVYEVEKKEEALMMKFTEEHPDRFIFGVEKDVLPDFEKGLQGLKAGDTFDMTFAPEQAFGKHEQEYVMELDKAIFCTRVDEACLLEEFLATGVEILLLCSRPVVSSVCNGQDVGHVFCVLEQDLGDESLAADRLIDRVGFKMRGDAVDVGFRGEYGVVAVGDRVAEAEELLLVFDRAKRCTVIELDIREPCGCKVGEPEGDSVLAALDVVGELEREVTLLDPGVFLADVLADDAVDADIKIIIRAARAVCDGEIGVKAVRVGNEIETNACACLRLGV